MQFLGKFGKIVCWRPPPGELVHPPRGNPGYATAMPVIWLRYSRSKRNYIRFYYRSSHEIKRNQLNVTKLTNRLRKELDLKGKSVTDLGAQQTSPLSVDIFFIFMQFLAINMPNNCLAPPWEILDPPLQMNINENCIFFGNLILSSEKDAVFINVHNIHVSRPLPCRWISY